LSRSHNAWKRAPPIVAILSSAVTLIR
jgi:hypothetical protein